MLFFCGCLGAILNLEFSVRLACLVGGSKFSAPLSFDTRKKHPQRRTRQTRKGNFFAVALRISSERANRSPRASGYAETPTARGGNRAGGDKRRTCAPRARFTPRLPRQTPSDRLETGGDGTSEIAIASAQASDRQRHTETRGKRRRRRRQCEAKSPQTCTSRQGREDGADSGAAARAEEETRGAPQTHARG